MDLVRDNKERVVLLLAAGFSIDAGYPSGAELNKRIGSLKKEEFVIAPNGELMESNIKNIIPNTINDAHVYEKAYSFLVDIIEHYVEICGIDFFDYERFYDAIDIEYRKEQPLVFDIMSGEYQALAVNYIDEEISYRRLVSNLTIIYDQLITSFLKKKRKSVFYKDIDTDISCYPSYKNFLLYLCRKSDESIIDVFTTNHDLLFESFRHIPQLNTRISDGFDDFGSEYFGLAKYGGYNYRCRLERYTGIYNTPIRLYKLHGSLDYVLYYKEEKAKLSDGSNNVELNIARPSKYVKIKQGISPYEIYKSKRCRRKYDCSSKAIRSDFLSGTQTKINKYGNPFLYKKLFRRFENCLRTADKLIIIGYGCGDTKINEIISNNYKGRDKKLYMINPDAENLKEKIHIDGEVVPISKSVNEGILECKI